MKMGRGHGVSYMFVKHGVEKVIQFIRVKIKGNLLFYGSKEAMNQLVQVIKKSIMINH